MTTVVAVKKNNVGVIAADTLTIWGSTKESANHLVNASKIVQAGQNYIGLTGSSSNAFVIRHWLANNKKLPALKTVDSIFDLWLSFHATLKDRYFIREFDDERDPYESTRFNVILVNPYGIFAITSLRAVSEYKKFTAMGSGCDYALGAMQAVYDDPNLSAAEIASIAINAAVEFDDGSGLPMELYEVPLK